MAEIIFDGVSKRFGTVEAVRDLSLHVADGEFLALLGPSGCGRPPCRATGFRPPFAPAVRETATS